MKFIPPRITSSAILFTLLAGYTFVPEDPAVTLAKKLKHVDRVLEGYVSSGKIAGVLALVLSDGEPLYERAFGWRDREAKIPMDPATIFRIASMTKAIVSAAVLLLAEEKKLSVQDEVSKYIPAYKLTYVAERITNSIEVTLVPAKIPITLHHLLTHTAGIPYGTQPEIAEVYRAADLGLALGSPWNISGKDEPVCATIEKLAKLPFVNHPGEGWTYGYATDILGCIVEKVSEKPLDEFIRQRITGPLGMADTHFFLPLKDRNRLAVVYASRRVMKNGRETKEYEAERSFADGPYVFGPRKNFSGGAGLLSTARDYARFLEMIRNGGIFAGKRIMKPESMKLMTTSQTGAGSTSLRGMGFSYGFETTERAGANGPEAAGSFGWIGAYGTYYRVDPQQRLTIILMTQMIPNATDIKERFWQEIYKALAGRRSFR
jgi:CubicO group peptidase (beta-lactamase class C family)